MTKDNIIRFPSEKIEEKKKVEQLEELESHNVYEDASNVAEIISSKMIAELTRAGVKIKVSDPDTLPTMIMMFESMRSLILQSRGYPHPLQSFSSKVYEMSQYDDFIEEDPEKIFSMLADDFLVYRDDETD